MGPGVWAPDYRHEYDLKQDDWKFDAIPEILNGKNIADYIDPDIEARLELLEKEEEQLAAEAEAAQMEYDDSDLDSEEEAAVTAIRERKRIIRKDKRTETSSNKPVRSRSIRNRALDKHDDSVLSGYAIQAKLDEKLGVDTTLMR